MPQTNSQLQFFLKSIHWQWNLLKNTRGELSFLIPAAT